MSRSTSPCLTKNWLFFVKLIALPKMLRNRDPKIARNIISPIFGLDLPGILQYSYIDKQIFRRLQAPRQINIGPPAFVRREQISIVAEVFLFFWAEGTLIARIRAYSCSGSSPMASSLVLLLLLLLLWLLLQDIGAAPAHLLQLLCTDSMVG